MNAYKLADEISNIKNFIAEGTLKQVANMLRQQEDCIAMASGTKRSSYGISYL